MITKTRGKYAAAQNRPDTPAINGINQSPLVSAKWMHMDIFGEYYRLRAGRYKVNKGKHKLAKEKARVSDVR